MNSKPRSLRDIYEYKKTSDDYEPLSLWLIPVYLRSRKQYYEEAVETIKKHVNDLWEKTYDIFQSRDDFEKTSTVDFIWDRYTPYWWGLNDVVGWIDIRICIRQKQIQMSLFLTAKKISRKLKDKKFGFLRMEIIDLSENMTNDGLKDLMVNKINFLIQDKNLEKLYVNLPPLFRVIHHTDLIKIIQEIAMEESENLKF